MSPRGEDGSKWPRPRVVPRVEDGSDGSQSNGEPRSPVGPRAVPLVEDDRHGCGETPGGDGLIGGLESHVENVLPGSGGFS